MFKNERYIGRSVSGSASRLGSRSGRAPRGAPAAPAAPATCSRASSAAASAARRVVSLKRKAGRAYANFGCSAHHGKGAAICGNALVISERKLNRAVIDELRKLLASKEIQARFVDGFTKRLRSKTDLLAFAPKVGGDLPPAQSAGGRPR